MNDDAIRAYREQRWEHTEKLWRQTLTIEPADPVALMCLAQIRQFRDQPPPADWDDSIMLEQK